MNKLLLTVFILAYNQKDYIEQCIKSVLEQKTNFNFQIIITDDCSTDGTSDIVRKYAQEDSRIIAKIRKQNIGAEKNIKMVFEEINTEFFTALEGDDYWCDENKLQKQIDLLIQNPECTVCAHETIVFHHKNNKKSLMVQGQKDLSENIYKWSLRECPYCHTSSRVYKNILPTNDKDLNFIILDIFRYYYMLDKGDLLYINEPMSVYNSTGKGIYSSLSEKDKTYDNRLAVFKLDLYFDYKYTDFFFPKCYPQQKTKKTLINFSFPISNNKSLGLEIYRMKKH